MVNTRDCKKKIGFLRKKRLIQGKYQRLPYPTKSTIEFSAVAEVTERDELVDPYFNV